MQFYILHEDPERNIEILPEYALKKVNVREGWQILSDIGHIHGVTWEGQNKLYSASHVLTRSFCQNLTEFYRFTRHYSACVNKVGGSWKEKYTSFLDQAALSLCEQIPVQRTRTMFTIEYILDTKVKHLKPEEIQTLYEELRIMRESLEV